MSPLILLNSGVAFHSYQLRLHAGPIVDNFHIIYAVAASSKKFKTYDSSKVSSRLSRVTLSHDNHNGTEKSR